MRSSLLVCAFGLLAACDKGDDSSSSGTDDSQGNESGDDSGGSKVDDSQGDESGDDSGGSKVDADNDGYDSTEDCDDKVAAVNPGATEVCDEIDNNCVKGIDEGVTTRFYADGDSDGYGRTVPATDACTAPRGFVDNADDCDDNAAAANPGGTEVCDGIDNDCDGGVDEGVMTPFYADGDGDGYGAGTALDACAAPTDYVANADDCDDRIAAANPGGAEVCDGVDNNCAGGVDEGPFYLDGDGDGYGAGTALDACPAARRTTYVANADDCDDTTAAANPDAAEVCDSIDNDCDSDIDDDDPGVTDPSTWYPDADHDGCGDSSSYTFACEKPSGYVSNGYDRDDTVRTRPCYWW